MEHQAILLDSWKKTKVKNNLILHFNYQLENKFHFFSLNESILNNLIEQLDHLVFVRDVSYWLTLARINELALLCTENYANNNELTLVGDLLLNPRLTLVHIKGENRPVVKKRHSLLTEQFSFMGETGEEVVEWLKSETVLEVASEALLPGLHRRLEKSGYFKKEFLDSLTRRKTKIAELTGFLSGIGPVDSFDLFQWLKKAGPSDRNLINSKLCSCSLDLFFELGRRVKGLAQGQAVNAGFEYLESVNKSFNRDGGVIYA